MDGIIFKDGTSFEIKEGAALNNIVFSVENFAALQPIADALTKPGNLDKVTFTVNGEPVGKYENMKYDDTLFKSVDVVDGKVEAVIAIREKTNVEIRLDILEANDATQDEALLEVANMIGGK